jgi:hypothetical protein
MGAFFILNPLNKISLILTNRDNRVVTRVRKVAHAREGTAEYTIELYYRRTWGCPVGED